MCVGLDAYARWQCLVNDGMIGEIELNGMWPWCNAAVMQLHLGDLCMSSRV